MMSLEAMEVSIARRCRHKATGLDLLSNEVMQAGGRPMAELACELAIKITDNERWPKEFQGGRVTELFKKGSPLNCDDYRGILLASHLAKLVLHQFLKPIKPIYDAMIPSVQMGAVSKRGTDFGTHMLTSFIEARTNDNDSIGVCFVDLVKAFDRVLRELMMGWPRSMTAHPIEYLCKTGVGNDDAIWIVNWITKRRPSALPQGC